MTPFVPVFKPNVVSQKCDEFYVSYNSYDTHAYGSDTTALVIGRGNHFYILNGDHRKQYKQASEEGGLEACFEYFRKNNHLINKHSERI